MPRRKRCSMPWGRSDCRGRDSPRNSTGTPSDWKRGTLTSRATRAAVASAVGQAGPWTAGQPAVGCRHQRNQGEPGPDRSLKMVHPARSSNSRAQWLKSSSKISQKWSIQHAWPAIVLDGSESRPEPPETRRLPLGERLMVLRGSETREENGRIGTKRQDATAANAGTAATKAGTSSSNRPNNQVPQTCSSNIGNRMSAFSPNARPSGLLPRKNLSSESQMEDRHIHTSHRQGRISLAHVAPPRPPNGRQRRRRPPGRHNHRQPWTAGRRQRRLGPCGHGD